MQISTNNFIGIFLGGLVSLISAFAVYNSGVNVNLDKENKITGEVTTTGIVLNPHSKLKQDIFSFLLDNSNTQFGVYSAGNNSKLMQAIKPGDTITVIYQKNSDKVNIDVYQIEKNGEIVLNYKNFQKRHLIGAILLGLLGLGCFSYLIYKLTRTHSSSTKVVIK